MSDQGEQTHSDWRAWADAAREQVRAFWSTTVELWSEQHLGPALAVLQAAESEGERPDPAALHAALAPLRQQLEQGFRHLHQTLDWGQGLRQTLGSDTQDTPPPAWLRPWLDLVAARLGPWADHQARQQALIEAGLRHQMALERFLGQTREAALAGVERLADELAASPPAPPTLQAVRDRYLQASEQAWEERLGTDDYRQAFVALSESSLGYTRALQQHLDHWLGLLDLPTRRGLHSTQKRLHELRQSHRALAKELERADLDGLRDEVRALREEVRRLRGTGADGRTGERPA
ncbi:poly(R)-hydroxyalkanoic acid synthase subunit PhaE [Alkalilimnicola ehrlichii MLHE-1]|uniref:Poly(3-hydroxyalkanoate) polymerase subunit PhaE n=1 Tax=Alkalilimnicola ehrlichii (strain ATCC BAA-1101 / DSM 17681 / MLHE-1) TaxID=187272 RepID=Q0A5R3_ALKEH|nr:poly(R)-hydroxyalkanoic acid synthase subunit PhaE [Alkalilimnicola ehrlichii]ABI57824.1 hypothetical protein Mlg_2484 [Alkalilimnicola ehrlichii MLHE-1]